MSPFPGSDYNESSIPSSVVIPSGVTDGCFDVDIIDNDENEPQENFQITAKLPGSTAADATTNVFITDNDGKTSFCNHILTSVVLKLACRYKHQIQRFYICGE